MCQSSDKVEILTKDFCTARSKVYNFLGVKFVIIAKLKITRKPVSSADTKLLCEWYVCIVYIYTCKKAAKHGYMCVCWDMNTHITHMYVSIYVCISANLHKSVHAYEYVFIHMYVCMHIYMAYVCM